MKFAPALVATVCVSTLVTHATPAALGQPGPRATTLSLEVFVTHAADDPLSLADPALLEVVHELRAELLEAQLDPLVVHAVLARNYPGGVRETALAPHYKAVWCADIQNFKIVCCEGGALLVRHPAGDVTVELRTERVL